MIKGILQRLALPDARGSKKVHIFLCSTLQKDWRPMHYCSIEIEYILASISSFLLSVNRISVSREIDYHAGIIF